jgi:hypothetical protein
MRPRLSARLVMRLAGVRVASDAGFLLGPCRVALFAFLGLPLPAPVLHAQLLGVALVALAIVEAAVADGAGRREVARGVAAGRALGAIVLAVWLASGRAEIDFHGEILLWSIAGTLALEAVLHAAVSRRGVRS